MDQQQQLDRIEAGLQRLEAKLDMLIDALAEEEPEPDVALDLDGNALPVGGQDGEPL